MRHQPIKDFAPGDVIESTYFIDRTQIRKKKDGADYATVTLRDATGSLNAVMWDNVEPIKSGAIREGNFALVGGTVGQYKDSLQGVIKSIALVEDADVDKSQFIASSPIPRETLLERLDKAIANVNDRDYKIILVAMFQDDVELREQFAEAPSALKMHQAYLGGLLEHTLQVLGVAWSIAKNYEGVNYDLLIAATLLHDLGKIREFEYETAIKYSDEGRLIGHIVIGIEMLRDRIKTIGGIDPLKETLLVHTILSHHGELEWGSPKRPMTLEALILHFADLVDSRLSTYIEHRELLSGQNDRRWSDYLPIFERAMYLPRANEEDGDDDADNAK